MTDVLISGAGPVGLWLAAELRLREIDVVVVETRSEPVAHSKALTIHPRTLELFAQRGVADEFLDHGLRIPAGHFGALEQKLDFRALETPFPFTLLFPQERTERILERRARDLGADVRRGNTLVDFDETADGVRARIRRADGSENAVTATFIAGCDGAGSTVRKRAGIDFPGTDADTFGILADVSLTRPPAVPLYGFSAMTGQAMVVPLPDGQHRIVGIDPLRQEPIAGELAFDEFRESIRRICGQDFGMHSPSWVSRYGNASRLATTYARGRVALAGDAAHMHFPAGGVGMNVGIQDAHGLGWRLADAVTALAPPAAALQEYDRERRAVGAALLASTQAQTAILAAFDPDSQALRALLNTLIAEVPELSRTLAARLSGLDVAYPAPAGAHPLVGRRLVDTADGVRSAQPVLLHPAPLDRDLADALAGARVETAPTTHDIAILVRPDGHVAWAAEAGQATPQAIGDAVHTLRPGAGTGTGTGTD